MAVKLYSFIRSLKLVVLLQMYVLYVTEAALRYVIMRCIKIDIDIIRCYGSYIIICLAVNHFYSYSSLIIVGKLIR